MTSWQNQPPMSRREAREAERRAAEALAERQPHPSGVVDFDPNGYGTQYVSDQDISVGDTTDIWQALSRRADEPAAPAKPAVDELSQFRSGVPVASQPAAPTDSGALPGDLMDRVREAVLRRERESQGDQPRAVSRRELRQRETSDLREDGLPTSLFEQRDAAPVAYDPTRPDYFDEPYTPEPTVVVPVVHTGEHRVAPAAQEPVADDRLAFSSPVTVAEPAFAHPQAEPEVEFLEPRDPWAAVREANTSSAPVEHQQAYGDVPTPRSAFDAAPPAASVPTPTSAFGRAALPEQTAFQDPELGPPSEVTDLAGFEALIRKARAQQPGPQPAAPAKPADGRKFAWADEDEAQDGFTGLIGRGVQGGHGSSNALILPSDPQPDLMSAVNSTGDIFVTGSMRLSDRFAMTGAMHEHDDPEIDRLYDVAEAEPSAGVAPVRASKAISGSGQSGRMVTTRRRGNVLPTVLAVVAGAMAVGVVTLLIGSWVLKLF